MIGGDDLRKSLRLGAIGLVTARADHSRVGQLWFDSGRIVSVLALRSVAGFAGNVGMTAQLFLVDDIGVAGFADVVAGEGWSASRDLGDGGTAIVAVLAKALGHDGGTQQDEDRQENDDDNGETDEMLCVLEHGCFPGLTWEAVRPDRACDLGYREEAEENDERNHRTAIGVTRLGSARHRIL